MLPTRFKIDIIGAHNTSMMSWETITSYADLLDHEIDYALSRDKVIETITLTETQKSWAT
jgi:hypothetical protein